MRVHRRVDELVDEGVIQDEHASNYQSNLMTVAEHYLLTKPLWGKDMMGLGSQTAEMDSLANKVNSFVKELRDPDTVELLNSWQGHLR